MVVWSFHDTLLKWNIQMTHLHIGQHLVNTVEKVYNTSKWTCFYIQFVHPNYIFFTSDEKHELVVFLIFWDKVCLWNGCYVNISRMVLILQWIAGRLASVYSNKRLDVCSGLEMKINIPYPKIFKIQLIHLFRQNQSKYNLDEQIVCKNTLILMYDILFQQCWPRVN